MSVQGMRKGKNGRIAVLSPLSRRLFSMLSVHLRLVSLGFMWGNRVH